MPAHGLHKLGWAMALRHQGGNTHHWLQVEAQSRTGWSRMALIDELYICVFVVGIRSSPAQPLGVLALRPCDAMSMPVRHAWTIEPGLRYRTRAAQSETPRQVAVLFLALNLAHPESLFPAGETRSRVRGYMRPSAQS